MSAPEPAPEPPRIAPAWLADPALAEVIEALDAPAYFVGGCVRNALLGAGETDVDVATPLRPEEVVRRIERAGLKAVPTGIEHGTVTAVAHGAPFEITTFRADVETDGRRAVVRFTEDMAEDARRRDFTMNALYAEPDGRVLDPLGGLPDLRAGVVRFIGRAEDRIREDYLRILRFFRFTAWYGRRGFEPVGLAACAALVEGVERLARERIGHEMRRLLDAPDPGPALAEMARIGLLSRVLPGARAEALAPLVAAERTAGAAPCWTRRLAALAAPAPGEALRLSRAEQRRLQEIARLAGASEPPALAAEAAGAEAARSACLLAAAARGAPPPADLEAEIARGAAAVFPLAARDLIGAGWRPGPALGRALAEAREAWRASGFALDRAALLARLPPPPG